MAEVQLRLDEKKHGAFYISEEGEQLGEMMVTVGDDRVTAHHTEVSPKAEGKGYAKQMFERMVSYARENRLQIVPLCTYVQAQLKRRAAEYADVWKS